MKLLLIAALAILATAHPVEKTNGDHEYVYIPDGDGILHEVDLNEKYELSNADIERNVNTITFNLYTRNNPRNGQVLTLNQINTVTNSHFNRNNPTRFVTHGWRSNQFSNACVLVRDAFLAVGNYNVIVVDWGDIARDLYGPAMGQVRNVAARLGAFIDFMRVQGGLNLGTTWTIGHSLGGHVAGIGARAASGTVRAVVALDPAGPGFLTAGAGSSVHRDDANQVQVIHTNGGTLGLLRGAGKTDFYPNGGRSQPGCGIDVAGTCAHGRAYEYMAESIRNPTGFRSAESSSVFMGGRSLTTTQGVFHLNTRSASPFAMG